uniref:Glyco_hydro_92 domain-containing protein n=1 Tax=Schistosoma mansoni TaxID=6183 RepID=A0A5K4F6Q2_SCHMA
MPLSVHYPNGHSIHMNPNNLTTEMKGNTLSIYLQTDLRNEPVLVEMEIVRK